MAAANLLVPSRDHTVPRAAAQAASPIRAQAVSIARRIASPLLLVLLWQAGSMAGLIPARTLAAPSVILATAWSLLVSGDLLYHLLISLERVLVGLALGVSAGALLALVAGLSRFGEDAVDAPMQMLRTLPHLALVPLFILWFGIGELPKVLLVALGTAFPVYLTLFAGIRGIDPKLAEAGRIFGLDRAGLIQHVILPGALPSALVVAEQVNANAGIGFLINDARDFLRTDVIVVGLLIYALLGLGTDALVRAFERRALAWRPALIRN